MFHLSLKGLLKKESPTAMATLFFKHPPTEARIKAKPSPAFKTLNERQLESGFGGWADEKIKLARAAHPHVFPETGLWHTIQEKPFKLRNSHTQHLTITPPAD
jgi:hypothetical protein